MARGANFYYAGDDQLGQALGLTLGRALFGDPEARAKLELQRAQMSNYSAQADEARAHAGLYNRQGEGVGIQNDASRGLPDMIRTMFAPAPAAPAQAAPDADPLAPLPDAAPAASFDPSTFRAGLPALIAAMAQMKGDKVDPNGIVGSLGAMFGDDEMARRALIAQGHTPGPAFAVTPERADDIRDQGFNAAEHRAVATANIGAATTRRGQDIRSSDTRRGQDLSSGDTRRGQDLSHEDRVLGITTKPGVVIANEAGGNVIARALGPQAVITDNARTPGQAASIYREQHPGKEPPAHSNHYAEQGYTAFDVRPVAGMSFQQARDKVAAEAAAQGGYLDADTRDEGTHWHMVIKGVKGAAKTASAAKSKDVSAADAKLIGQEITQQIAARGWAQTPDAGTLTHIREAAMTRFQQSGNPAQAVSGVLDEVKRRFDAKSGKKGLGNAVAAMTAAPKPAAGKSSVAEVKKQALAAIGKGADPAKVKARFKQMTGQELGV